MNPETNSDPQPDLPPVHQAVLDEATLEQLFQDIEGCTRLLEIIVKGAATDYALESNPSLTEAREALLSGQVRGIQIRYLYDNKQWWDTLIRGTEGIRLTRIAHQFV